MVATPLGDVHLPAPAITELVAIAPAAWVENWNRLR
jgi:hypothetical protein